MKKLLITALIVVSGCSTWKQKDFVKELEKSPETEAQVKVETKKEVKLLEKFEVQVIPEVKEAPVATKKISKAAPKSVKVEKQSPVIEPVKGKVAESVPEKASPKVKPLPKDYPEDLIAINEKAKKVWDQYRPTHKVGQRQFLDIHYMGITLGKIMVENRGKKAINDMEVWHFHARLKTSPFYSSIYELNDTVDTYVTTDKFLSTKYSLIQRESKQNIDDLQIHDRDQYKTFWFYHRVKPDGSVKDKKEENFIPYFSIDPFSVLFFFQGLPLKDGDIYEIPIANNTKILILRSEVEGREEINTPKGKKKAIRIHATTKYTGERLKSGDLYFWFSDDEDRVLLKAQAKIQIGSVTADISDD